MCVYVFTYMHVTLGRVLFSLSFSPAPVQVGVANNDNYLFVQLLPSYKGMLSELYGWLC